MFENFCKTHSNIAGFDNQAFIFKKYALITVQLDFIILYRMSEEMFLNVLYIFSYLWTEFWKKFNK